MTCLKLLFLANVAAALKLPAPSGAPSHQLNRRAFAAAALGSLPALLTPQAAHAGFATSVDDISEERLAVLAKNRQNFGDGFAFKIVCERDDEECLQKKREMANPANNFKSVTADERKQQIRDQANSCRGFCAREDLFMRCERDDLECLEKKQKAKEEAGVADAGKDFAPYVGGIIVTILAAIAAAPEKTANPKGMQIRENFYEKRKEDTKIAASIGLTETSAASMSKMKKARAEYAAQQAAEAPEAAEADKAE